MPLRPASSHDCGLVAAIQIGGCGFCSGFGMMLRDGMLTKRPWYSNGSSVHMRGMISSDSCHMSRDCSVSISKPACSYWLERPVPNSTRPFGQQVERRDALGDADRMVELVRQQHDAVADADALRALRDRGEEHLGRRGVRELGQEVVLDLPHGVEAEPVGELDLLERLLVAAVLAALVVRLRHLQLVEEVELHRARRYATAARRGASRGAARYGVLRHGRVRASRRTDEPFDFRHQAAIYGRYRRDYSTALYDAIAARTGPGGGRGSRSTSAAARASSRASSPRAAGAPLGVDFSAPMLARGARGIGRPRCRWSARAARRCRCATRSAALVTCGTSFHWLAPAPALAGVRARARAGRLGGALLALRGAGRAVDAGSCMEVLRGIGRPRCRRTSSSSACTRRDPFAGSGLEPEPPGRAADHASSSPPRSSTATSRRSSGSGASRARGTPTFLDRLRDVLAARHPDGFAERNEEYLFLARKPE